MTYLIQNQAVASGAVGAASFRTSCNRDLSRVARVFAA